MMGFQEGRIVCQSIIRLLKDISNKGHEKYFLESGSEAHICQGERVEET